MRIPILLYCVLLVTGASVGEPVAQSFLPMYETGTLALVEDVVFGSDDDEDDAVLYGPVDLCVDGEGNVYVLDYKLYCVKKFNANGEHILTFSRQGEGPGEMQRAYRMAMTPEGNLVVFDSDNHRLTVFDGDGEYVDSRGFQGWGNDLEISPDGSVYLRLSVFTEQWQEKGSLYRIVRLSPNLQEETVVDSVYVKTSQTIQATNNSMTSVGIPFVALPMFAVSPSGEIVIGRGDEYVLRVLSPELEPVREIRREVDRLEVTAEDREDYFDNFDDPDFKILVRDKVKFPGTKPYFRAIFIDHEGYLLVETHVDAAEEDNAVYDVFSPGGEFVAQTEMRDLRSSAVFKDGFVYMTQSSDEELPSVIRYRAQAASGPVSQ